MQTLPKKRAEKNKKRGKDNVRVTAGTFKTFGKRKDTFGGQDQKQYNEIVNLSLDGMPKQLQNDRMWKKEKEHFAFIKAAVET